MEATMGTLLSFLMHKLNDNYGLVLVKCCESLNYWRAND